jgi:DNA mismatch endonuclease (patch repair protein)
MADKMTKEQRHKCMSMIHSKNTRPEILVRKHLFANGLRYRIHVKRLPGTPDIVMRKYQCVIFINGCFWHGHEGCSNYRPPKSNVQYWMTKIERNRKRDREAYMKLRSMGWHVIQLWECQLKPSVCESTLTSLLYTLNHIFLLNNSIHHSKEYEIDIENADIAAEEYGEYKK